MPDATPQITVAAYQPFCPVDDATLARWRAELAALSPRNDQTSFLYLVWEPGWPWEPVGRFMLYDCAPLAQTKWEFLEEVRGPSPDTKTHWDSVTGQITGATLCNQTQWNLYRDVGRFSYPWWVIQGDHGGHKLQFTNREQILLRQMDLPTAPPVAGTLAYAPWDERVQVQVQRHDKLWAAHNSVRRMREMHTPGSLYQRGQDQAMRQQLMTWLADQVRDPINDRVKMLVAADAPRIRVAYDPEQRLEDAVERYVETGR